MPFESLSARFPTEDASHLSALAEVWAEELARIIERMHEISSTEVSSVLPVKARHEATFELAKLIMSLEQAIIEKKTASVAIESIDPKAERLALDSSEIRERIENTARRIAEEIWKPLLEEWHRRFPFIVTPNHSVRRKAGPLAAQKPHVKEMHYSPSFSNMHWASGPKRKVRVYSRGLDLGIKHRDVGYRKWGYEHFIYSQELERLFGLIEGDAKNTYDKLLNVIPLGQDDLRYWVAYLTAQVLRTPSYIIASFSLLRRQIAAGVIDYPDNIADLRKGYETLFTNNEVFAGFYRQLVGHRWEMWSAPAEAEFIRSDNPVLIESSSEQGFWRLVYPMTPLRCFIVGPEKADVGPVVIPSNRAKSPSEVWSLNERVASAARLTVIGRIVDDDTQLRTLLEAALGKEWLSRDPLKDAVPEYWGIIGDTLG